MKYLKYFESNEEDLVKEKYTPFINWDMIKDLKEISLDSLDDNFTLLVQINNTNDHIATLEYNHKTDEIIWENSRIKNDISISYYIHLLAPWVNKISGIGFELTRKFSIADQDNQSADDWRKTTKLENSHKEYILERIKDAYPDEMIYKG